MTVQDVNAGLKADPTFQALLQRAKASLDAVNDPANATHAGYDPNAALAVRNYADSFAKAHGFDPGSGGGGTGDRPTLDTTTGQYTVVHDQSGFSNGWQAALVPLLAGTGGALLSGIGGATGAGTAASADTAAGTGAGVGGGAATGGGAAGATGAGAAGASAIPAIAKTVAGMGTQNTTGNTTNGSGAGGNVMKALAALGGLIAGHELAGNGSQNAPPQLSQLLQMSVDRAAYQNPLVQAQTQGVYKMLPNFARTGTALSGTLSNQAPAAPAPTSNTGGHGGGTDALLAALGIGGGIGLGGALTGTNPYGTILDGIKKIFGGGSDTTDTGYKGVGTPGYPMPGETGFNSMFPPDQTGTNANDGFDPTQMMG